MPEYLASISFQNPDTAQVNLFQYAMQTELGFFDWLPTQPKDLETFSAAMAASSAFQQSTVVNVVSELFPPENSSSDDGVLLVDVGGGRGEILNEVRRARPDLTGEIIVQDLPKEIEGGKPADGIQSMAYDFFTPQPVTGTFLSGK
jgi:demethylsterigmatocystin 6-O-methyltransferase